ncbi:MAG: hypothetical protein SFU25_10580 [Candidatus Caenarcaniphilales bacterium]|nr:hypothetical protein [Candidatus Caenarcaniphilales bacterium]
MQKSNKPLTKLQAEILKIYSTEMSDSDVEDLKKMLANYFAQKAIRSADRDWKEKNYSDINMNEWLNG